MFARVFSGSMNLELSRDRSDVVFPSPGCLVRSVRPWSALDHAWVALDLPLAGFVLASVLARLKGLTNRTLVNATVVPPRPTRGFKRVVELFSPPFRYIFYSPEYALGLRKNFVFSSSIFPCFDA